MELKGVKPPEICVRDGCYEKRRSKDSRFCLDCEEELFGKHRKHNDIVGFEKIPKNNKDKWR